MEPNDGETAFEVPIQPKCSAHNLRCGNHGQNGRELGPTEVPRGHHDIANDVLMFRYSHELQAL